MSKKELLPFYRFYSGRKRLTIQEKESILDSVIEKTAANEFKSRPYFHVHIIPRIAAALALMLILAIPAVLLWRADDGGSEYMAKGDEQTPLFTVKCYPSNRPTTCGPGDRLTFRVISSDSTLFFAAFSKPKDRDEVIWYFPASPNDTSIPISQGYEGGVLEQAIVVGNEHPVGEHTIFGVFSKQALSRDNVRSLFSDANELKEQTSVMLRKVRIQFGR